MAGSEVYTYNLSKELAKRHKVIVFYRVADPQKDEYATAWGEYDGLKFFTINNTFKKCTFFELTYQNYVIDGKFGGFLDEVKPDVVHISHVTCLSTGFVEEAHKRGIPVVYTLHDFWLICPRGQFLKMDLSICHKQEDEECIKCTANQMIISAGREKASRFLGKSSTDLLKRAPGIKNLLKGLSTFYVNTIFAGQEKAIKEIQKRSAYIKEMLTKVDVFIAPSQFLRRKYIEFGIPEDKIIYSDNGFDTKIFKGIEKQPADNIRFGYIGTWIPSKGVHVMIEAFNRVMNKKAELKIYGKYVPYDGFPDYLRYMTGLIKNEGIRLMGEYDNKDIARILSEIDVIIVPSIWFENSPLTIHEAFLAGVPVVTSNIGGMAELVRDGVDGLHFKVGDSNDLYEKLMTVINKPSIVNELRKNIRRIKTIEEDASGIEKIYERLM